MTNAFPLKLSWLDGLAGGGWSFNSFALNQTTDEWVMVFQAHDAISIARAGFRYGSRTGTPPTYKISLQGVDGSGYNDGTIKGGASPVSTTFTPPADTTWNSTFRWFTFDNAYTTTRGEWLAIVIKQDSGSVDASNFSSFSYTANLVGGGLAFPYPVTNNNGTKAKQADGLPIFGYGTTSDAFGFPILSEQDQQGIVSSNEYGNVFTLPSGWGSSYKIVGVRLGVLFPLAGSTFDIKLYNGGNAGDTTVLQNITVDGDYSGSTNRPHQFLFDESTLSTLLFGNSYRLVIAPVGSTRFFGFNVTSNADLNAFALGVNCYATTRNGGNWTDTNTRRFHIEPIFADITGSSGGVSTRGIFTGGRL